MTAEENQMLQTSIKNIADPASNWQPGWETICRLASLDALQFPAPLRKRTGPELSRLIDPQKVANRSKQASADLNRSVDISQFLERASAAAAVAKALREETNDLVRQFDILKNDFRRRRKYVEPDFSLIAQWHAAATATSLLQQGRIW